MALGFDPGPSSKTAPPPQPPAPQRSQQKCVEKGMTSEMGTVTKSPSAHLLPHSNLPKLTGVKQLFYHAVSVPRRLGPPPDSSGGPSFPFISKSGTWAGRTPGLEPLHTTSVPGQGLLTGAGQRVEAAWSFLLVLLLPDSMDQSNPPSAKGRRRRPCPTMSGTTENLQPFFRTSTPLLQLSWAVTIPRATYRTSHVTA